MRCGGGGGNHDEPIRVLNVAEKPSVARALASVFARMGTDQGMRRDVHQVFTHIVDFPDVLAQPSAHHHHPNAVAAVRSHTMITTSVRGHLASQDFGPEYGWNKCDPVALFTAPIQTEVRGDLQSLEEMLHRLASSCRVLILWLDCDREGEAIAEEVAATVRNHPPAARGLQKVLRARFSTVLAPEIQRALCNLDTINLHLVHAVQARSELDLRVGAAFTRFQTMRLQRRFDALGNNNNNNNSSTNNVISYGPCQFPTLGFVVERWARIETFVPEDFWYNEMALRADNRTIHLTWNRGRLFDRTLTAYLYENCVEAQEAIVTKLHGRPKNKWRPVPLATVELQKRASRFLRMGAETLMAAAEELYHNGYISYPRTETEKFRPEFQHRPLLEQFANLDAGGEGGARFATYARQLLEQNKFQNPRAGQHDDQAHPPITPCKAVDPNTITDPNQRGVYTLVVKHYLACCSRDAVGRETELTVRMDTEEFTAKGLMILEKNWLEIYEPWERWSTGQGELPPLEVGSRIRPSSLLFKEGRTTPPQPLTEVELITLMDRNGIGTDATIAQHIATIQDRDYVIKDAQTRFHPTKLGIALVEGYNSMGYQLNKPDLRRETEAECNLIATGRKTKEEVVQYLLHKMRTCYEAVTQEARKLDQAVARHFSPLGSNNETMQIIQARFSLCGACNEYTVLKQERNNPNAGGNAGVTRRKVAYCNTCRTGWSLPRGTCRPKVQDPAGNVANDNRTAPAVRCPICNYQVIQILRGEGYEGNGYHVCPKCFSDPPVEHGGPPNGTGFRCFSCTHPSCTLATGTTGGDVEVFACPFCSTGRREGKVCLRKNSRGFVLSCNNYANGVRCPYTIWLPKECQDVTVLAGNENNQNSLCVRCSSGGAGRIVRQITMVWKPGSVPPLLGRECTTCILCDVELRRDLQISLPQPNNQVMARPVQRRNQGSSGRYGGGARTADSTARGRGHVGRVANARPGNHTGGRGRGNANIQTGTCYKCGQPGHFANRCPNG
jgi:DNA topoisomerase-3